MSVRTPDETHDPSLASWVDAANADGCDFPIQNLPFGVFRQGSGERRRIGVAIGNDILDLDACVRTGLLDELDPAVRSACRSYTLNALFALGAADARRLRRSISATLRADTPAGTRACALRADILTPIAECSLTLPADIGDYTDFYASVHHASNVGALFRPDNPLLPNYKWIPVGYHGRASSIVPSGTPVRRPRGQRHEAGAQAPIFGAARMLDYEVEVGAFVGTGNAQGTPIPLARSDEHMFGLCLVNDWSARDIQSWEYQPLGPFLSKDFATSISPWVVTIDALVPFRVPRAERPAGDPAPLAHLDHPDDRTAGAFEITLEVWLRTARMRQEGAAAVRLSAGAFRDMYWTLGQMLAHHTSNGCNLRAGDLFASGTVSGPSSGSRGCLLELTQRGREPLSLPGGETRAFLEDGDEVTLRGWCERDGYRRIGFGECRGAVLAALAAD